MKIRKFLSLSVKGLCFVLLTVLMILPNASCNKDDSDRELESSGKFTGSEMNIEDIPSFSEEPLKILYFQIGNGAADFGITANKNDNLFLNFMTLSNLCEEKLGFPLKFIDVPDSDKEYNAYLAYLNSGLSADLIFPSKPSGINHVSEYNTWPATFYWNDQYIEEGVYMDITEYIPRFCPQAIINFEKYPMIKEMCSRNGRIYALYAGMPHVYSYTLIIKKSLLEENNLDAVNSFEVLSEMLYNMYRNTQSLSDEQKIYVSPYDLLLYSIIESGYCPLDGASLGLGIVVGAEDKNFTPIAIEDTDILDRMYEEFTIFFQGGYFTEKSEQYYALLEGEQDMFINNLPLSLVKALSRQCVDEKDNFFNKGYSIFLLNTPKAMIRPFNIHVIPVPYTSEQPEKALHFMQWLMTDSDAADILTFGSSIQMVKHYRFSSGNIIIPEPNNTIYGFCDLIANFSDKPFLCGNSQFHIAEEVRKKTYDAIYPFFYRTLDSDHMNLNTVTQFSETVQYRYNDRRSFLRNSLHEWMTNPNSPLTPHDVKKGLAEHEDNEDMMNTVNEYVQKIRLSEYLEKER
ncbi:MAG: hypothetical protein ACOX3Q_01370 [Clostridia bacterium]|jgi:hypothetical protein